MPPTTPKTRPLPLSPPSSTGIAAMVWLSLVALSGGCAFSPALLERKLEVPPLSQQGQEYYHMVNRLKSKDFSIDFEALRLAWTHTPQFLSLGQREKQQLAEAYQLAVDGRYKKCLKKSGQILIYNYTSLLGHNWAQYCANQLQLTDIASFHTGILNHLLYSILATGDGDSEATAWKVTGPAELTNLLLLLGIRLDSLTLVDKESSIVRIDGFDQVEQQKRVVWADYSLLFARYNAHQAHQLQQAAELKQSQGEAVQE